MGVLVIAGDLAAVSDAHFFLSILDNGLKVVDRRLDLVAHYGQNSEVPRRQVLSLRADVHVVNRKRDNQQADGNSRDAESRKKPADRPSTWIEGLHFLNPLR